MLGVCLALLGLMGSLFIRPRRAWVRARGDGADTLVEVAVLDRSGVDDLAHELTNLTYLISGPRGPDKESTDD